MGIIDLKHPLVFATASEARRALVAAAGIAFIPDSVDIDESAIPGETVDEYVLRLASAKVEAVIPPSLEALVVAVDTAIGFEKEIIGKPRDEAHARQILSRLSGVSHEVASAIAIRDASGSFRSREITRTEVEFAPLSDKAIEWYLSTGEWRGRAGAYAIQGKGSALIASVCGCFTNVIGISIPTLIRMLKAI